MRRFSVGLPFVLLLANSAPLTLSCSTPAQRQQVRQNTRIEQRTRHRQDERRGWDEEQDRDNRAED